MNKQITDYNLGKQMMADAKLADSYTREVDGEGRRETMAEAVGRVMDMHRTKYSHLMTPELKQVMDKAQSAYTDRLVLGAQRALQFGGDSLLRHEARGYNCSFGHLSRVAFFQEAMYLLLCGCGVGFSVQKHHIAKLPAIYKRSGERVKVFQVPDSIEGWSDAFGVLISSYFEDGGTFPEYKGCQIHFDFSKVRPRGAPISGGFLAPGPEPLRRSLERCEALMEKTLEDGNTSLKPIVAYDFVMHMSDAVLSGGVRRSATICLFSKDDEEMLKAKTGDWFVDNPQRGRSNNSVVLKRDELTREDWSDIMKSVKDFGEPGFVFVDNVEIGFNPCCVSGDTWVMTDTGAQKAAELVGKDFSVVVDGQLHPAAAGGFWQTGVKPVYEVTTKRGHSVKLTDDHRVKRVVNRSSGGKIFEWAAISDMSIGESMVLSSHIGSSWGDASDAEVARGYILGSLVGDGTFIEPDGKSPSACLDFWEKDSEYVSTEVLKFVRQVCDHRSDLGIQGPNSASNNKLRICSTGLARVAAEYDIVRGNKTITESIERTSSAFHEAFLRGLFDADGSVQGTQTKGVSVRLSQSNMPLLKAAQRMLLRLGVNSTIYACRSLAGYKEMPNGLGGTALYWCQDAHELVISSSNIAEFSRRIGFMQPSKRDRLAGLLSDYKRKLNREWFDDEIVSIELIGEEPVYDVTVQGVHEFCANGIQAHNCEIGMLPVTESGEGGFQFCCLSEINGGKCVDKETFYSACETAAILGTLQAGYTNFKYLGNATKEITERESLIGVSITGWMNNPDVLFDEETLKRGAEIVKETNRRVSALIGIRPAARTTCAKPSGNASVLLGTASGIHGEHSPRYLRNVQMSTDSPVANLIAKHNPKMVEKSVWSAGGTDFVISFPVTSKEGSIYKRDLMGVKQLDFVKMAQQNWVEHGTNVELCTDPRLRHNISNTISVDDWDEVEQYLFDNRAWFAGVSLLAASGDKGYAQAPFTEVHTAEEILKMYGDASLFASGLIVEGLHAFNENLWQACDTAMGFGLKLDPEDSSHLLKRDWVRRFHKFADNYFDGDMQQTAFCLKDCFNLHKWVGIQSTIVPVDFSSELRERAAVDVDTMGSQACAGGVCELVF